MCILDRAPQSKCKQDPVNTSESQSASIAGVDFEHNMHVLLGLSLAYIFPIIKCSIALLSGKPTPCKVIACKMHQKCLKGSICEKIVAVGSPV